MTTKKSRKAEQEAQDRRIKSILDGPEHTEVSQESLEVYRDHLKSSLVLPCMVSGIEDFPWEERIYFAGTESTEEDKNGKEEYSVSS